jgi:hypothetical protein
MGISFFNRFVQKNFSHTTSVQNRPIYWHISATFVNRDFSKVGWNFRFKVLPIECQNMSDSLSEIRFQKFRPTFEKSQFKKKLAKLKQYGLF